MFRRSLTAFLTAALVAGPAAVAFADDAPADETTALTATTTEEAAAAPGLTALADLVDAISAALDLDVAAVADANAVTLTQEDRDAFALLLDQILEVVKVESLVARADTAALEEDEQDEADELEAEDAEEQDEADDEAGDDHGAIVRTVAHCAPRGKGMRGLFDSIRNHGALVSAAAQGGTVTLAVPTLTGEGTDVALTGETTEVTHTLDSVEAAEALCADLETIARASALSRELASDDTVDDEDAEDERKADRDAAKDERKAEREAAKDEREAEREAAKQARAEAKGQRADHDDEDEGDARPAKAERPEKKDRAEREHEDDEQDDD